MSTRELAIKLRHSFSGTRKEALLSGGTALYCALLSGITLTGVYAPFGVSAVAFGGKRGIFAFLGAICGYVLFFTPNSLLYCASLLVAFGVCRLLTFKGRRIAEKAAPIVSALSTLVCCMPRLLSAEDIRYEAVALAAQTVLVPAVTLLLIRVDVATDMGRPYTEERVLLCIATSLGLCGLSCLLPGQFDPVHVLICGAVLWTGLYGGVAAGGAAGCVCGSVLALCEGSPFLLLPFSLGGVLGGLLARLGKAAVVTGFLVCCAGSLALCGVADKTLVFTLELLGGCVLLLLLPDAWLDKLGHLAFPGVDEMEADRQVSQALLSAGKGLTDAADCIVAVSDRIRTVNGGDPSWVCESASEVVCARCGLKNHCWNEDYSGTMTKLSAVMPLLQRFGRISRDDLPGDFTADCPRSAEMAATLNRFYGEYALKKATDDHAFQMRGLLAEQFRGLGNIVTEMSTELGRGVTKDRAAARRIMDVFAGECLRVDRCDCLLDRRRRMVVEVEGEKDIGFTDMGKFLPRLEEALGRRLGKAKVHSFDDSAKVMFRERTEYRLETAVVGTAAGDAPVSGDQRVVFEHGGVCVCLISDGMGCGSRAAVESRMTVSLLQRLILAGFTYESAIHVVNWALMVKGGEERLSTVDLLSVDLYTGATALWKAGAAPSFLRHGKEVKELSFPSLPIGILNQVNQGNRSFRLCEGDLLVMVSDGALYGDNEWLRRELLSAKDDLSEVASSLLRRAKARRPSAEEDDITVLCARLVKSEE